MPVKPREAMTVGPADSPVTIPAHVRVERYGPRRGRIFIDGQPVPWATSSEVVPQVAARGLLVDVTFAVTAFSAEIVFCDPVKSEANA